MIDRFLYEDAVAFFGECLHSNGNATHHTGDVANHLARHIHTILLLVPSDDAFVIRRILASVAKDALLQAFANGVYHERRCAEVHIRYPHRDEVVAAALFFYSVNLNRISSLSRDYLIEIVNH